MPPGDQTSYLHALKFLNHLCKNFLMYDRKSNMLNAAVKHNDDAKLQKFIFSVRSQCCSYNTE